MNSADLFGDNINIKDFLTESLNNVDHILLENLNSTQRHTVYCQMTAPLKFKKLENNIIKVWKPTKTKTESSSEIKNNIERMLKTNMGTNTDTNTNIKTDNDDFIIKRLNIMNERIGKIEKYNYKINRRTLFIEFIVLLNLACNYVLFYQDPVRLLISSKTIENF